MLEIAGSVISVSCIMFEVCQWLILVITYGFINDISHYNQFHTM